MINIDKLKSRLNKIRRDAGLIGGSIRITPLEQAKNHVESSISMENYEIKFQISQDLDEILLTDENTKEYLESCSIKNPVEEICEKIITHEIWHWKRNHVTGQIGCPTDILQLNKLLETTYFTLEKEKVFTNIKDEEARMKLASDVSNLMEDMVVNTNMSYEGNSDGLSLVYYLQGMEKKEYGLLGEAYLKLQMSVWGSGEDKKLLQEFYSEKYSEKAEAFAKKTLEDMGISNMDKKEVVKRFRDMSNWETLWENFTKNIAELLKEEGKGKQKGKKESGENKGDKEQQESGGQSEKDEEGENKFPTISNSPDREIDKEAEKKIVLACCKEESGKADIPKLIRKDRILTIVYDHLSEKIPIKASARKEGFEMPLAPLSFENFDVEEHRLEDIDFTKVSADAESPFGKELNFQVSNNNYSVFSPYKKVKERLPDILFLFDCSGSMADGSQAKVHGTKWAADSKYHYALLGAFGAVKWLRSEKIAPYLKYNVTMFSDGTRTSGWKPYHELEKSLEMFWQPEFGNTYIKMEVLAPELQAEQSVVIFISDGNIFNWNDIKEEFRRKTKNHMLSYIQIKDKTATGEDLKKWGIPVYHVSKKEDLQGLIIDLTKQSYKQRRSR